MSFISSENKKYSKFESIVGKSECITFFTPTFNRAQFLYRIYDNLICQTDKHFVWIIVNDGSSDNTDEVMSDLLSREELPIHFISKPNGGKHSAFEAALNECATEYFQCMDDDDVYSPDSVAVFLREWERIKQEGKYEEIGAIRALSIDNGKIVAKRRIADSEFEKREDKTTFESNYIDHEHMENWTNYRTDALRSIDLFPHDYWLADQHRFYAEKLWQGRFARKYKCRYYYHVLREYRHDTETSLMKHAKSRQHYIDLFINEQLLLNEQLDWFRHAPISFLKDVMIASILCCKLEFPYAILVKNARHKTLKILYICVFPLGYVYSRLFFRIAKT